MKNLAWESFFFNQQCGEFNNFREDFNSKKALSYDWIQSKTSINANHEIHFLEKNGFLFEDLKLTFDKILCKHNSDHSNINITIRESFNNDIEQAQKIAKSVLPEKSRFISIVGKTKTADFYSEWIKKSITHDFDHKAYVALDKRAQILGFITLKYIDKLSAQIGLLAVSNDFQKRSIASNLLSYCERLLLKEGIKNLRVSTEGKNIAAQRFYIKNKFNINKIECWFYRK